MSNNDPFKGPPAPGTETIKIPVPNQLADGTTATLSRQTQPVNAFREQMPTQLMRRPGFGREGKPIKLALNSHHIANSPDKRYYQYSVQIGNDNLKRGLIKAIWSSEELNKRLPGGIKEWLYDGVKLAWSQRDLQEEFRCIIDLDNERGRNVPEDKDRDIHRVIIKKAGRIDLNNIYEYLNGKCDIGPGVFDAINFLDHLIRENPSKKHINIKKSYFDRLKGGMEMLTGGVEAFRGIYQSIRMAERMVVNVDVSHTTFWARAAFPSLCNSLVGHTNPETLGQFWRDKDKKDPSKLVTNFRYLAMRRLKKNDFIVQHRGRSKLESEKIHKVRNKQTGKDEAPIDVFNYFQKKYNIYLEYPDLPVVQDTRGSVFPMEVCQMVPGQRYPYKLTDQQTRNMLNFAVQVPDKRLEGIKQGTAMLNWAEDPYLKHYGLQINPTPIQTNARILPPPTILFDRSTAAPGTKGRWDLRGKKFLHNNPAPLEAWGVAILTDPTMYGKPIQPAQVSAFINTFIQTYRAHGGQVTNTSPIIQPPNSDPAKAVEMLFFAVGNKHNCRPQVLLFVLQNTSSEIYLRVKKSCDCRYGVMSQCMVAPHVLKNNPQYHSNVLMKVNAKLGGTTARVATKTAQGHFTKPTMIIGADVSHAAPGIDAPSYAAMTMSMDKFAARYAAGVQTNGYRVEMISSRNLRDMLIPMCRHWMATVSGGRVPSHVYYFRDGVSEGQYLALLKYEVADLKEIFSELAEHQPDIKTQFTVIVAEKRHHIRFFPGAAGDENHNPLPGTIVEHDVTHPFENDIYLCSHRAIKGTARPTHYHMLLDEAKVPIDVFQKLLYEHSYQYMRSTTPVSLFPAVYYAHLASLRARSHEDIPESERKKRDNAIPSGSSTDKNPEEAKPLLPILARDSHMPFGMWFI
ncbi:MAG: hypothetical protein Q9220_004900 [cf. Caloplaca sp. 1 TL-2023]